MKKHHLIALSTLILSTGVLCGALFYPFSSSSPASSEAPFDQTEAQMPLEAPSPLSIEESFPYVIAPKSTFFATLRQLNVDAQTIQALVDASRPVHNLAKIQAGIRFQLTFEESASTSESETLQAPLREIEFRFSAIERLKIHKLTGSWKAEKIHEEVELKTVHFSGVVTSSLWESAQRANMDTTLIAELTDIFGWEIDFSREVRLHDRWRLSVEQKLVRGQPVGWGAILAAEYENSGELHQAALFRKNGEDIGYFNTQGESLRKMFLKSPIRFGRITSGFNLRRFHPILKTRRPHLGVDYAAPTGTPIRAVGDGVIQLAGWKGGGGNVIQIRHNSTYQTNYLHLNGFAKGIRKGTRVKQGQVIGYVGTTGLSTGPHLHFEFYQAGRYVDPLGKKFPSADPVPQQDLAQFLTDASPRLANLPEWETPEAFAARITESERTSQ